MLHYAVTNPNDSQCNVPSCAHNATTSREVACDVTDRVTPPANAFLQLPSLYDNNSHNTNG